VLEFVPVGRIIAKHQGDSGIRTLSRGDLFSVLCIWMSRVSASTRLSVL